MNEILKNILAYSGIVILSAIVILTAMHYIQEYRRKKRLYTIRLLIELKDYIRQDAFKDDSLIDSYNCRYFEQIINHFQEYKLKGKK